MLSLPVATWVRFLGWLNVGMLIYWFYGRVHSPLADAREAAARTGLESLGNFVTVVGALLVFNGFFMVILAFMTLLGMTSETLIKWHEIGVTPEQSDRLGLIIFGTGIATVVVGRLLAKAGRKA
jgi:C-terminus of AA_permease